jgi:predicted small integral membrane protein
MALVREPQPGSRIASWTLLALGLALGALWLGGMTGALFGGFDLTKPLSKGSWMAWNGAGALFFSVIAVLLLIMILWGALAPEVPRRGVLGIETTPGDRLFITLLGSAFIQLIWLFFFGAPLWGALSLSLVWGAAVFRWV